MAEADRPLPWWLSDTALKTLWGMNAAMTVYVCRGPFWLQMFAAFCVGLFWRKR